MLVIYFSILLISKSLPDLCKHQFYFRNWFTKNTYACLKSNIRYKRSSFKPCTVEHKIHAKWLQSIKILQKNPTKQYLNFWT